ncbi:UNVERIFIED_ORG: hypothetical protein L601_000300001210 [Gordonia westfalica J30]
MTRDRADRPNRTVSDRVIGRICAVLAAICGAGGLAVFFHIGWSQSAGFPSESVIPGSVVWGLAFLIACTGLLVLSHGDDEHEPRIVGWPVAGCLIADGLGALAYTVANEPSAIGATSFILIGLGAAIAAVAEMLARRLWRRRRIRERAEISGVDVEGTVTHLSSAVHDDRDVWWATVSFSVPGGTTYTTKHLFDHKPRMGARVGVRYLPEHPARAVVIRPPRDPRSWSPGR